MSKPSVLAPSVPLLLAGALPLLGCQGAQNGDGAALSSLDERIAALEAASPASEVDDRVTALEATTSNQQATIELLQTELDGVKVALGNDVAVAVFSGDGEGEWITTPAYSDWTAISGAQVEFDAAAGDQWLVAWTIAAFTAGEVRAQASGTDWELDAGSAWDQGDQGAVTQYSTTVLDVPSSGTVNVVLQATTPRNGGVVYSYQIVATRLIPSIP